MSITSNANKKIAEIITISSPSTEARRKKAQDDPIPSTTANPRRFAERSQARELGYEMPLNTREAGEYVGLHLKTVERMARAGEIPAHPVCGVRRKTWKYYPSELDAWLRAKVDSPRHPCSPNGKDTKQ